jgi:hypothetical protein
MTKQRRNNKKQGKGTQFRLLTLKQEVLKISVSLRTAFAVVTHLAEAQANMLKSRMFRVETRRPTVSRREGQHLLPLKTFIKKKASK